MVVRQRLMASGRIERLLAVQRVAMKQRMTAHRAIVATHTYDAKERALRVQHVPTRWPEDQTGQEHQRNAGGQTEPRVDRRPIEGAKQPEPDSDRDRTDQVRLDGDHYCRQHTA